MHRPSPVLMHATGQVCLLRSVALSLAALATPGSKIKIDRMIASFFVIVFEPPLIIIFYKARQLAAPRLNFLP